MTAMPLNSQHRKMRWRNITLAVALGAMVALFFLITLAKLGGAA
jgi:putative effector of murein hydrolase